MQYIHALFKGLQKYISISFLATTLFSMVLSLTFRLGRNYYILIYLVFGGGNFQGMSGTFA